MAVIQFEKYINIAKSNISKYTICFVTNVDGKTDIKDYPMTGDSILTEYFTEDEYNTILNAIKEIGFYVKVFFNEIEFINYVINSKNENILVFNLARNGKGLCKKALIPSFCEFYNIPHTGSNAYTVCLGRHKFHYNKLLSSFNLNVVRSWLYSNQGWLFDEHPPIGTKIIVKPTFESASRGVRSTSIFIYENNDMPIRALQNEFQQDIIVQEFISGYEIQIPIIMDGNIPSAVDVIGISMDNDLCLKDKVITYDLAFSEAYNFYSFNNCSSLAKKNILHTSEKIAEVLGMKNYGRCDYRLTEDGKFYLTDISTHPYLIYHSAFAFVFLNLGYKYSDIFAYIIGNTINEYEKENGYKC